MDSGKLLAEKYCQSCHLLPDPSELDKTTWAEGVMPAMGPFLGIFNHKGIEYPSYRSDPELPRNFYPSIPIISEEDWNELIEYYVKNSPDSLSITLRALRPTDSFFLVKKPAIEIESPAVTLTKFHDGKVWIADLGRQTLYRFDNSLTLADSVRTFFAITDMQWEKDKNIACDVGMINPNNGRSGRLTEINFKNMPAHNIAMVDSLARPVSFIGEDLDADGRKDWIACEFGHLTGSLSWFKDTDGSYKKKVIKPLPGAIRAITDDTNGDGQPDIWVLFSQAKESIVLFTNEGNDNFSEREVLAFPAVYGSTYFELTDIDKDGDKDIIYTCGDNADYSIIFKPYHGIYIYLNDGRNNFTRHSFLPVNGCYKAIADDYDGDGDIDLSSIAFFADYKNLPGEGFIFFENRGGLQFTRHTIPGTEEGRWLTMDAADIDNDGDRDVLLGNFSIRPSLSEPKVDWRKGPLFLLLENKTKR